MTSKHRFHQLDVFSDKALLGNPLAVVHDAADLTDVRMAAFANWTNLSETTFILPPTHPTADYRLRIFTTESELPFAGHPTLGSCYAWLAAGGQPKSSEYIIQECGIGLVRIRNSGGQKLAFAAPLLLRRGDLDQELLNKIAASLDISKDDIIRHQWIDNGPGWYAIMLKSAAQVLSLKLNTALVNGLTLGVIGPQPEGSDTDYEVRAFFGDQTVIEDPVTGSLNAGLAVWLIGAGIAADHYVVSQGTALNRRGRVFVDRIDNDIWIGGDIRVCVEGSVSL